MMEGCVGEWWRRAMKGMKEDRMSGSLQLTVGGFSLIRWGICRRHADQPTAHFYGPQSSHPFIPRSFNPFLHPPLPCFQGLGRRGWDVMIYTSVHVCVSRVCLWGNDAVPRATFSIQQTHYQPIGIPDYRQKAAIQYLSRGSFNDYNLFFSLRGDHFTPLISFRLYDKRPPPRST